MSLRNKEKTNKRAAADRNQGECVRVSEHVRQLLPTFDDF